MSPVRVLRGFFFGAVGGLLGWILTEFLPLPYPFAPARFEGPGGTLPSVHPTSMGMLGLAFGLAVGLGLGLSEGLEEGTGRRFNRILGMFLAIGAVGGFLGMMAGQLAYTRLGGNPNTASLGAADLLPQILARSLSWMFIGLLLGMAMGGPNLSVRRMVNGLFGGALGGFLGGAVFQLMVVSHIFGGMQGRMVGFIITGALIGFFISLIAEAAKRVWVKVLIGRNEGREHVIDQPIAYVGRDELVEIPVFLDPAVPRRMASFRLTGGRYGLFAESQELPILVNGQPLTAGQLLRDGDAIQFGRVTLGYYEKATATGSIRPVDRVALSAPAAFGSTSSIPSAAGVCPFCGLVKDAAGHCGCSVGDAIPGPAPAYGAMASGPAAWGASSAATVYAEPAVSAGEGPRLLVTAGPLTGQVFVLASVDLGLGRDPTQDVALVGDSTASRRHARLTYSEEGWVVTDEGSANGTWVNGVRVQQQHFFPGDELRIGQSTFRFEA